MSDDMKRKVANLDESGHEDMLGLPKLDEQEFLVTGWAEFYVRVSAPSEAQAVQNAEASKKWHRTLNCPMKDIAVVNEGRRFLPETPEALPEQKMFKPFFDLVAPEDNWKNPIDATIDAPTDRADRELFKLMINKACVFYAGCIAHITDDGSKQIRVEAVGYYRAVGA